MKSEKTKPGFNRLRATYLCLSLAAVAICGFYGCYLYTLFRDAQLNMPQPQIERLTRDLRLFHSRTRQFPKNFNEINDLIWHTHPKPDYGADGRQARVKNYRYFYTRVNDRQCVIWAIPLGPQRHYGSTFFVVLSPGWMRSWKGRAMSDEEMAQIPAIPSPAILAELKLRETPSRVFSDAFTTEVPPFDEAWRSIRSHGKGSDYIGCTAWERCILFQIADLRRMAEAGTLEDEYRYFGIDSPTGFRWYNLIRAATSNVAFGEALAATRRTKLSC